MSFSPQEGYDLNRILNHDQGMHPQQRMTND